MLKLNDVDIRTLKLGLVREGDEFDSNLLDSFEARYRIVGVKHTPRGVEVQVVRVEWLVQRKR